MTTTATPVKNPMARVMSLRDFRLLFAGAATSLLGDQLALIATPWLVLQLTGDPLALGLVLALEGVPRAAFMLLGGAISDRLSPRRMMLIADVIRLVLTMLMAGVVFSGAVQLWMLYAFGLGFGIVAGFAVPAENSIVPMIVQKDDLQAGNSIMMGITQLVGFVGPTVAGILIGSYAKSTDGVALAYALDTVSFAVSAFCIWQIQIGGRDEADETSIKESLWESILTGMKYLWNNRPMRLMFLVLTMVNFLMLGPLLVGIPVLADSKLAEGAVAFGILMSAFSGGNLLGFILAGALPRPGGLGIRVLIIALLASFGIVIGLLGFITSTWLDFALLFVLGMGNGYIAIILFTWMQTETPKEMLGRIMSILMFSNTGLIPVSQAISGATLKWNFNALFVSAGTLVLVVTVWAALHPSLTAFSESLTGNKAVI